MRYLTKRIIQAVVTFFVAITVAFILYRMLPGGPITQMVAQRFRECVQQYGGSQCDLTQIQQNVEMIVNIDPDKPIPIAYIEYLQNIFLRQDFGNSIQYGRPVFDILFNVMPWSLFISLHGLVLGWTFNIFFGAVLAYKEGSRFDKGGTLFAIAGNSTPYYVAAILSLSVLAYQFHLFPQGGRYPGQMFLRIPVFGYILNEPQVTPGFNLPFMVGATWSAMLPVLSGFVLGINGLAMRGNAVRVLESDYIRVGRLRGLSSMRLASRYVARNAVLPLYTGLMIGIAGVFSSSIVLERIFTYPAVGWYTYQALKTRDYPLLMGSFIFYTAITIIGILVAEFTYGFIDPRVSEGGNDEAH